MQASDNKHTSMVIPIALFSLLIITSVLTSCLSQSNSETSLDTITNHAPRQTSLPTCSISINETKSLNSTNFNPSFSTPLDTASISSSTSDFITYGPPDPTQFYFSFPDNTSQSQIAGSDADAALPIVVTDVNETNSLGVANSYNNDSSVLLSTAHISLCTTNFTTYTYGGYSVQELDPTQFYFSFPDNTSQSQIAGSDAVTSNTYTIHKVDFEAKFSTPEIWALGFDEMVIFAASNTCTYKGTEFGIRMDLKDGFICGYAQEPNVYFGDVDFQILNLTLNDGMMHHYTLTLQVSQVSFWIDGTNYGYLNFPSNNNYSNLTFSLCAVVHRFTDNWDSNGDNMIAGNFSLNKQ